MPKGAPTKLSRDSQKRFCEFLRVRLAERNLSFKSIGVPRTTLHAWRKYDRALTRVRAIKVLKQVGASWRDVTSFIGDAATDQPANINAAWALAVTLRDGLDLKVSMLSQVQPDNIWWLKAEAFEISVAPSGWCEVYHNNTTLLAGDYHTDFSRECVRVLKLLTAPQRRKKAKATLNINSLRKGMAALHINNAESP